MKNTGAQAALMANEAFAARALDKSLSLSHLHAFVQDELGVACGRSAVYEARSKLRESDSTLRPMRRRILEPILANAPEPAALAPLNEGESRETKGDSMNVSLPCSLVQTEEQLLDHCKIDRSRWFVESMKVKAYQGYIKNALKQIEKTQLYSIQATLKKHPGVEEAARIIADLLADANAHAPVYTSIDYPSFAHGEGHLLELALFDVHVGKMCWAEETGSHYDLEAARAAFLGSIEHLVGMASGFKIERILLPIGNDFFNSEGKSRATTNGTPQEDVCRWQRSFTTGRQMVVDAIDRLRCVAPVDVVMVAGNHDTERVYTLGEVLCAWYRNCDGVTVDNAPSPRKYYSYGDNLTMFTHGNEENPRDLPTIMATGDRARWGTAKFCEIHTGHFHKRKEVRFTSVDENTGVIHRILPSLSGTDAWHHLKGYAANRGAMALIYHPSRGHIGQFAHQLV